MHRQEKQNQRNGEKKYRGWTIVCARFYVQVGRGYGGTFLWECGAYKEGASGAGAANDVEPEVQEITPARSFDEEAAYQEACARIDRVENAGSIESVENDAGNAGNAGNTEDKEEVVEGNAVEAEKEPMPCAAKITGTELALDPLATEFSTTSKLMNEVYRVESWRANHRRETRHRVTFKIRSLCV